MLTQTWPPSRVYQPTELRPSMATACLPKTNLAALSSLSLSSQHHNVTISTQIKQKEDVPFIAQYLISSFGFSDERAIKVASDPKFSPIKTAARPDSVVRFFKDTGLTDKEIRNLISWWPLLLASNVEKTLKPRANELMAAGFTGDTFLELIKCNPMALILKNTQPALQFWTSFLNNNDKALLKVIKRNPKLMNVGIDNIIPKMNLLHEFGLSNEQITRLVSQTRVILKNPANIKALLERTENLGFQRGSKMFVYGLIMVGSLNEDTIERKINFFKNTYDLTNEEVNVAIKKFPPVLLFSEENVRSTMDFLVNKFGFDARSVALQPSILAYSLKGRLIPRHYVIDMLKSKGLEVNYGPSTVIMMREEAFVEKLIEPFKKELPELGASYAAF